MEQGYPPARAQVSEIVHAPNLKNKIGAGSALILSLRNSGENPNRKQKLPKVIFNTLLYFKIQKSFSSPKYITTGLF